MFLRERELLSLLPNVLSAELAAGLPNLAIGRLQGAGVPDLVSDIH